MRGERAEPVMPKEEDILASRIPWSIVSKAADKSSRTRADSLRLSIASSRSYCMRRRAREGEGDSEVWSHLVTKGASKMVQKFET